MANTDLHIRIKSKLGTTQQVLLYQEAVTLNIENFKTAAWEHRYLAPGAAMNAFLPMEVCIGVFQGIGHNGKISSKLLPAEYNTAWDIYSNSGALNVRKSSEPAPDDNSIEIHNKNNEISSAIIAKDGKPRFLCSVRPDFKVRFSLNSKIYIALSEFEITDPFFDAATLSRIPVGIDYEGQQYLTIVLSENEITGAVDINFDFFRFEN